MVLSAAIQLLAAATSRACATAREASQRLQGAVPTCESSHTQLQICEMAHSYILQHIVTLWLIGWSWAINLTCE